MIFSERRGGAAVAAVRTDRFTTRGGGSSGSGLFTLVFFFVNSLDILLTPRIHDFFRAQGGGSSGSGADTIMIYDEGGRQQRRRSI